MKKPHTLKIIAGVLAIVALLLALLPAMHYGTNGDHLRCNQQSTTLYYKSVAEYLFLTQPLSESSEKNLRIGTCPYQNHYARTYAIELWVLAGSLMLIVDRKRIVELCKT